LLKRTAETKERINKPSRSVSRPHRQTAPQQEKTPRLPGGKNGGIKGHLVVPEGGGIRTGGHVPGIHHEQGLRPDHYLLLKKMKTQTPQGERRLPMDYRGKKSDSEFPIRKTERKKDLCAGRKRPTRVLEEQGTIVDGENHQTHGRLPAKQRKKSEPPTSKNGRRYRLSPLGEQKHCAG